MHGLPIAVKIPIESTEFWRAGALNVCYPVFELYPPSLADQHHETLRRSPAGR